MSRMTIADLATMMTAMQNDCQKIQTAVQSIDARLTALEKSGAKSTTAKKPTAQKPKASDTTAKPVCKWVLNKQCIWTIPNPNKDSELFVTKGARKRFREDSAKVGATPLNKVEREAWIKKYNDQYATIMKFPTEKEAKAFYKKWTSWTPDNK